MKKLLVFIVLLAVMAPCVSAEFLGIKQASETVSFFLNKPLDSLYGIPRSPDSVHLFTYADNATAATFQTRSTTFPFSDISIDTLKHFTDTMFVFADAISDIDGAGGHFSLAIEVQLYYDKIPTTTHATVQIISDSLENFLDASKDSSSSAAVLSKNNLDSLQAQDGWVAHQSTIDSVLDSTQVALFRITDSVLLANRGEIAIEVADSTLDTPLTGATHNVATSLGRRVRSLLEPIASGTAQVSGTPTDAGRYIILAAATSEADDFFNGAMIHIESGTGIGQVKIIEDYTGATDSATLHIGDDWITNLDATSVYDIFGWSAQEVVHIHDAALAAIATESADSTWLADFEAHDGQAGSFGDSAQAWGATSASSLDSGAVSRIVGRKVYGIAAGVGADSVALADRKVVAETVSGTVTLAAGQFTKIADTTDALIWGDTNTVLGEREELLKISGDSASWASADDLWEYDSANVSGAQAMGTLLKDTSVYQGAAAGLDSGVVSRVVGRKVYGIAAGAGADSVALADRKVVAETVTGTVTLAAGQFTKIKDTTVAFVWGTGVDASLNSLEISPSAGNTTALTMTGAGSGKGANITGGIGGQGMGVTGNGNQAGIQIDGGWQNSGYGVEIYGYGSGSAVGLFSDSIGNGLEIEANQGDYDNVGGVGINVTSNGGHAVVLQGDSTGNGLRIIGGDENGSGMYVDGGGGNSHGISTVGTGTGSGIQGTGGNSNGSAGITAAGGSANSHGLEAVAQGTGGDIQLNNNSKITDGANDVLMTSDIPWAGDDFTDAYWDSIANRSDSGSTGSGETKEDIANTVLDSMEAGDARDILFKSMTLNGANGANGSFYVTNSTGPGAKFVSSYNNAIGIGFVATSTFGAGARFASSGATAFDLSGTIGIGITGTSSHGISVGGAGDDIRLATSGTISDGTDDVAMQDDSLIFQGAASGLSVTQIVDGVWGKTADTAWAAGSLGDSAKLWAGSTIDYEQVWYNIDTTNVDSSDIGVWLANNGSFGSGDKTMWFYCIDTSGTDDTITGVSVTMYNSTGSLVGHPQTTPSSGIVKFAAPAGDVQLVASMGAAYTFPDTTVTATLNDTVAIVGYNTTVPPASGSSYGRVYAFLKDASGNWLVGANMHAVRVKSGGASDTAASLVIPTFIPDRQSDDTGYVYLDLMRTGRFAEDTTRGFYDITITYGVNEVLKVPSLYVPATGIVALDSVIAARK